MNSTRYSARLTDQRYNYALSCRPYTIHVCHLLPISDIKQKHGLVSNIGTDLGLQMLTTGIKDKAVKCSKQPAITRNKKARKSRLRSSN